MKIYRVGLTQIYIAVLFEHDINLTFVPAVMAYYELNANRTTTKRNTLRSD